jgi:hypothetical protein
MWRVDQRCGEIRQNERGVPTKVPTVTDLTEASKRKGSAHIPKSRLIKTWHLTNRITLLLHKLANRGHENSQRTATTVSDGTESRVDRTGVPDLSSRIPHVSQLITILRLGFCHRVKRLLHRAMLLGRETLPKVRHSLGKPLSENPTFQDLSSTRRFLKAWTGMLSVIRNAMTHRTRKARPSKRVAGLKSVGINHDTTAIAIWAIAMLITKRSWKHLRTIKNAGA